jgi:hypothetical protein
MARQGAEAPPGAHVPLANVAICASAGSALLILGIGGFVVGPLVSATVPLTNSTRFPLGDPDSVDTNARGRIYVSESFYKHVQRFSRDGEFEVGWRVDANGPFRLRAMPDSTVEVAVAKARSVFVYASDGKPVARRPLDVPFEQFASATASRYSVRGPLSLRPGVVRISDGRGVISDSLPLLIIRGPFPAWCFGLIGVALLGFVQRSRRHRRIH